MHTYMPAVSWLLCEPAVVYMQGPPTEEDAIAAFLLSLKKKMASTGEKRAIRPPTRRANA